MNREIKFRAWFPFDQKTVKESIEMDGEPTYGNMHYSDDYAFTFSGKKVRVEEEYKPTQHVMQFTCLHDKNQKEIYEGDILGGEGVLEEVRFIDGCWYGWSDAVGEGDKLYELVDLEVIGNIYENPSLLQQ